MTHVLFLRAVNLGKTNKVPMKQLVAAMERECLGQVSYLLQSGNVIVAGTDLEAGQLERHTEQLIEAEFGVNTVAIRRTPAQLATVVATNPYTAPDGGNVHVAFWEETPEKENLAALAAETFADAQLTLLGNEAYMRYEGSTHTSKLSNALLERRLKVPTTSRNVRTLERLLALETVTAGL